jgi:serine/threonine protein kinase
LEDLSDSSRIGRNSPVVTRFGEPLLIHDHLVTVWELGGVDLAQRLKDCERFGLAGIPPQELLGYVREATEGIDFLNGQEIYHRDIKPGNLRLFDGHRNVADLSAGRWRRGTKIDPNAGRRTNGTSRVVSGSGNSG